MIQPTPTYTVAELCAELRQYLSEGFAGLWVAGEVQRLRPSSRGHLYFELVEKGPGDAVVAKLDAVVWRLDHLEVRRMLRATRQEIAEGTQIRCRVDVDFYAAGGRLQLVVREVDPVFGLGLLERRRRETLEALAAAGLLERNRALPLAELPLRIALVTSRGSAAYHDFLSTLRESGYGFAVALLHAAVQGPQAEQEVRRAIATAARLGVDCTVVVRGGGSRTDLAVFDSRAIAEAVARSPVPVLTGLGHEIDEAIADRVAHTALKTPTKAAEFLIERVARAERALAEVAAGLGRAGRDALREHRVALAHAERGVRLGATRLAAAGERVRSLGRLLARAAGGRRREAARRLEELGSRLRRAAPPLLARRRPLPAALLRRAAAAARAALRQRAAVGAGLERVIRGLDPGRTLARGFSITRTADGSVVREPAQLRPGDAIMTELRAGTVRSVVERVTP